MPESLLKMMRVLFPRVNGVSRKDAKTQRKRRLSPRNTRKDTERALRAFVSKQKNHLPCPFVFSVDITALYSAVP